MCFAEDGKEMFKKFKTREQNCCFYLLKLLLCGVFTAVAIIVAKLPDSYGTRLKWYRHEKYNFIMKHD